jgi:hypothetical protein
VDKERAAAIMHLAPDSKEDLLMEPWDRTPTEVDRRETVAIRRSCGFTQL